MGDTRKLFPIFLIGYRCTGKTTTGGLLAKLMNRPFVDTDMILESQFNISIAQMVKKKGWAYFREKESLCLTGLDLSGGPVVATGGGIVLAEENRGWIKKSGHCVWLSADADTLVSRIGADSATPGQRPDLTCLTLEEETRDLLEIRVPLYRELAKITIDTVEHSPERAAGLIKRTIDNERL